MPSTPAVRAPRLVRTRAQVTARTAGSTTRLNRSSNRRAGSLPAHWCSLVWILSTRTRAATAANSDAPVFTGDLLTFQFQHCELAAALGHVTGFPGLGLLRRLRPTTRRSADGAPSPPRPGRPGGGTAPRWFPRSPLDRSTGSAPSYSPAASPRLPRSTSSWPSTRPTLALGEVPSATDRPDRGAHRSLVQIRQIRADVPLWGVLPLVPALVRLSVLPARPGPSGSIDPS